MGNEPGSLLLDDPFLPADSERLHRGFASLSALADDSWQVLYLRAKEEIAERMVAEFDLDTERLEPVPVGDSS